MWIFFFCTDKLAAGTQQGYRQIPWGTNEKSKLSRDSYKLGMALRKTTSPRCLFTSPQTERRLQLSSRATSVCETVGAQENTSLFLRCCRWTGIKCASSSSKSKRSCREPPCPNSPSSFCEAEVSNHHILQWTRAAAGPRRVRQVSVRGD